MDQFLTPDQVAEYLKITAQELDALGKKNIGPLKTVIAGNVRYRQSDVDAWVDNIKGTGLATHRRSFSARDRARIFQRDAHRCRRCGASPATDPSVELEIAHMISVKDAETYDVPEWFTNSDENLAAWCKDCNRVQSSASVHLYEIIPFYLQLHAERQADVIETVATIVPSPLAHETGDAGPAELSMDRETDRRDEFRAIVLEILGSGKMLVASRIGGELRARGHGISNNNVAPFLDQMVDDGLIVEWNGKYRSQAASAQLGFGA